MLTPEEIKARATSLREALVVSKEVWTERAHASEKELKQMVLATDQCGLCHYYGFARLSGHGDCPLHDVPVRACCSEYHAADGMLEAWQDSKGNLAKVRAAFWSMVARLESELAKLPPEKKPEPKKEEPKLRHGDYGPKTNPWIHISGKTYWDEQASNLPDRDFIDYRTGNIFDDLATLQEDVERFAKTVEGGGTLNLRLDGRREISFFIDGHFATGTIPETEEIILKLRQLVATAKREQIRLSQLCKENKK